MNNNIDTYQKIMEDIVSRSSGEYFRMSYSDKVMTISIMTAIKETMDNYYRETYPMVKAWADLSIEDIQLRETEPDMSMLNDTFVEQFTKLMGI